MHHILGIESIISQFLHHYLIRWKIEYIIPHLTKFFCSKQQNRLAYLITMLSIFYMAYRAYCQNNFKIWILFSYSVNHGYIPVNNFITIKSYSVEERIFLLVAVSHNKRLFIIGQVVCIGSAPGNYYKIEVIKISMRLCNPTVYILAALINRS